MKYYFIGHTSYLDEYLSVYKQIIDGLTQKAGWKLIDNWINREVEAQTKDPDKAKRFYKYYKNLYKNTTKKIKQSDIVVAEMSEKSTTVAQQVVYALENNIPVWCLCREDKRQNIPVFLSTRPDGKLIISYYNDKNLDKLIEKNLSNFVKREIKFNFYLNQDMYDFLEKLALDKKSTKSKVVREIILEKMRNYR